MRTLAVLALSLAVAMTGCFGGDDDAGDTTNPTPVTGTPAPTGGTGTGTGNGTGTGTGNGTGSGTTPPAPVMPKELCSVSVNFAEGTPPVPPAPVTRNVACGAVTAGYRTLALNINWTTTGPAVAQNGVTVSVLDAAGTVVATCSGPAAGPSPAAPPPCSAEGDFARTGDYTIQADGSGNIAAAIAVSIR